MTQNYFERGWLEAYGSLVGRLWEWRDPDSRPQTKEILPFVRGLRFAALLINSIQQFLPDGFKADWGQIFDQGHFSRECDILIYEGKPELTWNDSKEPVMKYVFVRADQVQLVISCKQWIKGIDRDIKNYYNDLKCFVKTVWLFSECCWAKDSRRVDVIRSKVEEYGYERFCYLYRLYESQELTLQKQCWIDFIKSLKKLKKGGIN